MSSSGAIQRRREVAQRSSGPDEEEPLQARSAVVQEERQVPRGVWSVVQQAVGRPVQRTRLKDDDPAPADGPDPEAAEIEWWHGDPYILDDKNTWVRVTREVVNNQRGERGANHRVDAAHLAQGARKAAAKGASRLFALADGRFLQVIFNYSMVFTAYYMSDNEARRSECGPKATDTQWALRRAQLPTIG